MKCQRQPAGQDKCSSKATMYVMARGGKAWDGYFCSGHATSIIKLRMRLIKKYNQNVVLRPITEWDRKRLAERRAKAKQKGKKR